MRAVLIAVIALAAGCDEPDTSTATQSLSACVDSDNRNYTCTTGGSGQQCGMGGAQGTCYCPEAQPNELTYCATPSNCNRPEYPTFCKGGCGGTPTFTHWCVSGAMP